MRLPLGQPRNARLADGIPHPLYHHPLLTQHHFTRDPHNAIPRKLQSPLLLGIERSSLRVVPAIDLNDELRLPTRRSPRCNRAAAPAA